MTERREASNDLSRSDQIDLICDAFEQQLRAGQRPRIEGQLDSVPFSDRPALFRVLLQVELEVAPPADSHAAASEYVQRFPEYVGLVKKVFEEEKRRSEGERHVGDASSPTPAHVRLEVLSGAHAGEKFDFDRHDTFLVGRAEVAHLRLQDDRRISRHQFRLEISPPECRLTDLESRNGTFVNSERVRERDLIDGDVISAGETKIRVLIVQSVGVASGEPGVGIADWASQAVPGPLEETLTPHPKVGPSAETTTSKGYVVAGYQILKELGRGGMGIVYQALRKSDCKEVAIKVIPPTHAATPSAVQFFLREASILSSLRHPQIVKFHEFGMSEGQLYLVMEYVNRIEVKDVLSKRSAVTSIRIPCAIICQVLEALSYAHSRGFVHRDVKPSNVLLSKSKKRLHVKLSDFGLAKNYVNAGFSEMTGEGETRGTLAFMAPEQLVNSRFANPSCDLYSAGATLYYYLTGENPFDFSSTRNVIAMLLEDDPIPVEERRPDLPPELVAIIRRALSKEPSARFISADEMRSALYPFSKRSAW